MDSETEVEEGEACFFDSTSTFDPDVSLSYLDEKLHSVLGHFQKDFEGGVSAENLGSRFGGYGSFLPTYQRSPSWPEANSCYRQTSTNDLLPEPLIIQGGRTSLGSSCTPLSGRPTASSARSAAVPVRDPSLKGETNSAAPPNQAEGSNSKNKKLKKPIKASDLKTLKVRIKVGTTNLLTRKNAEIYSGLGLDDSPSSSLDGSPMGSEGVSHRLQASPDESPTSILQMMTSHPMHDILLLSPLSDELINLSEKEKLWGKRGYEGKNKASLETSVALANGIHYVNGKALEASNLRTCNKNAFFKGKGNDNENSSRLLSKKEVEVDALACDELVSMALKLPPLSNASPSFDDPPKVAEKSVGSSRTATKSKTKEASFDRASKRSSLSVMTIETNSIEGSDGNIFSSGRTSEVKGIDYNDHSSECVMKDDNNKEEKADAGSPFKQPSRLRSSSKSEDGIKLAPEKELFASGDTGKSYGTECRNSQSSFVADSSTACKGKKTSSNNTLVSKSDSYDMKKNLTKDKYKEFFGDTEYEPEDAETGLGEMHSKEMHKGSDAISKKRLERDSSVKERINGRNYEKGFASTEHHKLASNEAPHTVCGSNPVVPPGAVAPLVKEDWVCCDKCQTWRILPLGTNPETLPDKWVCSMQTWLPGMNHCGISEEETTKALRSLYQVPTSVATAPASDKIQLSQHEYPVGALSGVPSVDTSHAAQNHQKVGLLALDGGGKKLYGSKGVSSTTKQEGSLSSSSRKRNRQGTPNSRNSNGTTHSPADENGHQQRHKVVGLPSSSIMENQRHKQKEKRRSLENHSDGGIKNSKIRNLSETDLDGSTTKKFKIDNVHYDDGSIMAKPGQSSTSGLSNSGLEKVRDKYKYKNSKADSMKSLASAKNPDNHTLDGSVHKRDSKGFLKKRKQTESQNSETHTPPSRSRASGGTDGRGRGRGKKAEQLGQDVHSTLSQPSIAAATSSSSKVSGSHKTRATFQELKGSPVESVSSSPLRISNMNKLLSTKRNPKRKYDHKNASSFSRSTPVATHLDTDVTADPLGQANEYASRTQSSAQDLDNERRNSSQCHNNGSTSKDDKVSSSQQREKNRTVRSDSDKCETKDPDFANETSDRTLGEVKLTSGRSKFQDKSGAGSDRLQQSSKTDPAGKLLNENVKRDMQPKFGDHDGSEVRVDVMSSLDKKHAALTDPDDGRSSRKLTISDKTERVELVDRGKSHLSSPSTRGQNEPVPAFKREGAANTLAVDALKGEMSNASRQGKKPESQLGNIPNSLQHSTHLAAHKVRDLDARSSPIKKESASQAAANALKEAKNLKHSADRLKNSGSSESTSIYFQATLKFLHGASLLESCNDNAKHSEMNQSRQIYSSTAMLLEYVAHEYEKLKDMAAVALVYKCMEVACMRVVYSSNFNANRHRNELQTALQIFPPGESPSSSASDVDNLNNLTMVDKVALAKGVGSPQVAGNNVISAKNRPSFTWLLNFAQEVNLAMEASRKSRSAFAAACPGLGDAQCKEPILSVKKALDFNFQDVDGLLRLVRVAMEAINR